MNLSILGALIQNAVTREPIPGLLKFIPKRYYQPYYTLMWELAPYVSEGMNIVELGVNKGYALNSFALGNPGAHVVGLDLNVTPDIIPPNVEFHLMSALPVPDFLREKKIQILHIDTEHSYGNAKNEFWQYEPYLVDGAIVLFDDLHAMDDGVLRAFYELPFTKIQCDVLHPGNGYGVVIYDESKLA